MVERGYCIYSISLNIFNLLLFTLKQLPSVSFGISFEHAVQLPFTVFLYSPFPDNYAFLSLSPSQIKNIQSADTVSPLVRKSILAIFTKIAMQDYLVNILLGIAIGYYSFIAN